ncbi:MAG: hypothetical protein ACRC14_18955 [Paracoccaceae bacterium]
MDLQTTDPKGLIRESYLIDGITPAECRSVFMDWALSLPVGAEFRTAVAHLIATYRDNAPDHPMTAVLHEGQNLPEVEARRRGGRAARVPSA